MMMTMMRMESFFVRYEDYMDMCESFVKSIVFGNTYIRPNIKLT